MQRKIQQEVLKIGGERQSRGKTGGVFGILEYMTPVPWPDFQREIKKEP